MQSDVSRDVHDWNFKFETQSYDGHYVNGKYGAAGNQRINLCTAC